MLSLVQKSCNSLMADAECSEPRGWTLWDRPGAPGDDDNELDPATILPPQGPQEWRDGVLLLLLRGYQANAVIPTEERQDEKA